MRIREAASTDHGDIHSVYWSAFPDGERELVAKLAVDLLSEDTVPRIICLVAETAGEVVGHTAFSPVFIDDEQGWQGYILAPLAVKPEYQSRGIGSQLIESGMQQLADIGADIVFVYGDPEYYRRFGFRTDVAKRYLPPYELKYAFGWQGIALAARSAAGSLVKIRCVKSLCDPALW